MISVRTCGILALVVVLVSCVPHVRESLSPTAAFESPTLISTADASPLALEAGKGAIQGRLSIESLPRNWKGRELRVYACPFSGPSDDEGFYVLEPSVHPSTTVSPEGYFRLTNLLPGAYVLVIGPSPEEAIAFQELGRVKVFRIQAGQVLDLGEVSFSR
ncbi:MAG: carboxypeptidase-like regulatory domain-containing protein [Thermofilaceae archaeon]